VIEKSYTRRPGVHGGGSDGVRGRFTGVLDRKENCEGRFRIKGDLGVDGSSDDSRHFEIERKTRAVDWADAPDASGAMYVNNPSSWKCLIVRDQCWQRDRWLSPP
jgi:hypothetical protein